MKRKSAYLIPLAAAALVASLAPAYAQVPAGLAEHGKFVGQDSPSNSVEATVWLNLHNKAELDARVKALYTKGSPTYHQWLTNKDLEAYAPTAAEVAAVEKELAAHNLKVTSVSSDRSSVSFTGVTSDFEAAFHTQVSVYNLRGESLRSLASAPSLGNGAAGLVRGVTGFEADLKPHILPRMDLATGKPMVPKPLGAKPAASTFAGTTVQHCVGPQEQITLTSTSQPGVTATYSGFPITESCGYTPQDLWGIYGLNNVYSAGYTGTGQTIVIVDAYGSPTIQQDIAEYSTYYGLPAPNLTVVNPTPVTRTNAGWAEETTLDVEMAHAIAPNANIVLVATASSSNANLQGGVQYAINNNVGFVISNSYGSPESESSSATLTSWDQLAEQAAAKGISFDASSGDDGDFEVADKKSTPDVSSPADSPNGTAVGGTSVVVSPLNDQIGTTGWGNNLVTLYHNDAIEDPPNDTLYGFYAGAGGGLSTFFAKPAYQSSLSGSGRHIPDVSAIADPFTGVNIIQTVGGGFTETPIGGTSVASPVFSAMWALANQYAGNGSGLGQAAPYIAQLAAEGAPEIVDVLPPPTGFGATGSITDSNSTTNYDSDALSQPLQAASTPINFIFGAAPGNVYSLTLGTDSSLAITQGWDPVTGYGTLNFSSF